VVNPAAALARGRAAAEGLMVDACTITRVTGTTTDPTTGHVTETAAELYVGKCRVQQGTVGQGIRHDTGETSVIVLRLEVQLPMSVVGLAEGDRITITASAHDADLVDRRFRIHDLAHKTHATSRRVQVTEVTG
jgi:hypothetical protein